jgi:hypothetical protein
LDDEARLVARTKVNRAGVTPVLPSGVAVPEPTSDWIFDDTDLYHAQLQALVSAPGAAAGVDPIELARRVKEAGASKVKLRKEYSVKSSKGKQIRYVIHKPLEGFMAPELIPVPSYADALFSSLFGAASSGDEPTIALATPATVLSEDLL